MNVLEKAEKALEFLKNSEGSAKSSELQSAAGTLGRCLGVLGSRPNCAKHYANLLHSAIPILLSLASNDSAEVRLVGDEALNRTVVGGFAFHAYKTNIILQNHIDHTRNARWIRAALNRICLGDCWLRPGLGKIRTQAQTLFPKISEIIRQTNDIQLIVEALQNNLPRLLTALGEYTTDEEISDVARALITHVESREASVRRGAAACLAALCHQRETLLASILAKIYDKLWPTATESNVIIGWFCVIKAIFQANDLSKFIENDVFSDQEYMELYQLSVHYIEQSTDHNIQNAVLECLSVLLSKSEGCALLRPPQTPKYGTGHRRNISAASVIACSVPAALSGREPPELSIAGALHIGSVLQLHTPSLSVEDLTLQTPDSPASEIDIELPSAEQLSKDLSEKLQEIEIYESKEEEDGNQTPHDSGFKINIGAAMDDDVPLKYCARLLASKFLMTGNKGGVIPDRSVRVSVKSSALNCLSEILNIYPQAMTMYLDKDVEDKSHNVSGASEGTDCSQDNPNEFILERNIAYQDSLSDSFGTDLLNRSIDSQPLKKEAKSIDKSTDKSLDKSMDSIDQKSTTKDVQSNILETNLVASAMTDSTNPNMTNSNFTTNSNMTTSNDPTTGYPMSSSGDVLSSSIDLDMKFDHFGESTTQLDNVKDVAKEKRPLKRTDVQPEVCESLELKEDSDDFVYQHMSDVFVLFEGHNDPQVRGLIRVCIGNYLSGAFDRSNGDYTRWKYYCSLPKEISDVLSPENLMDLILKGIADGVQTCAYHSTTALSRAARGCRHTALLAALPAALHRMRPEVNYWRCSVALCHLYQTLPYELLFVHYSGYRALSKQIMGRLVHFLEDQDQKVRTAASKAIADIIPKIYPSRRQNSSSMLAQIAAEQSRSFIFDEQQLSLDLVRNMYFYCDIPEQLKKGETVGNMEALKLVVGELYAKLVSSSCKYFSQGILETLHTICLKWSPWNNLEGYTEQGILAYCLDSLDCCGATHTNAHMLNLCRLLYPVEIHNIMRHKTTNRDIFERDTNTIKERWNYLDNARVANLAEKFLQVTLKMLNLLVHLIEEINPNVHLNKSGIALPGSPVRRKTQDAAPRRASNASDTQDDKNVKKRPLAIVMSLKANLQGHFYNEPFYMKLYDSLRATYSNHKINLDPKSSIFYEFLTTVLNCLSIQLELSTEKEFGTFTEEILYYLRVIMPLCPEKTVFCITQLLKCLFGTNMLNQYSDYMTITDKTPLKKQANFYDDVLMINSLSHLEEGSRRDSVSSNSSQKLCLDLKNPRIATERQLLMNMENFSKNRTDRKWSTNKKELERYIRLFEPVVIQALKSYTMQNDIPLQCKVLSLLNQLLTLRVNYCMLDSDQVFIGFLMKQLDLVEQHEIPDCCDLVNSILMFLVQLSSSKHHTKQIIEIPKLIQLCDGLMASGAHAECTAGLQPVAVRVFSNFGGGSVLGRAQQQEAQATREVLFYMLQKTMHQHKVLELVSCVLSLSQDQPESYYRWSELATDTLLNLLTQRTIEIDSREAIASLERLLDSVYRDVLLEQGRVEVLLKILFKAPPDQATTPFKLKLRYLSIIMILLRKVFVLIPESEILLSINYLKATCVSPHSIFFNIKTEVDPLNVQNVNENCANLSPDVILVRFLFKTLTYALTELEACYEPNVNKYFGDSERAESHKLLHDVCVNIIIHVKHMMHLTNGCLFPLTAKTAQTLLHNEQSGLNTGLYSPTENIPLAALVGGLPHRLQLARAHTAHACVRLNLLTHKNWQKLMGTRPPDPRSTRPSILDTAIFMIHCEYFVDNGLSEAVHLSSLLVNRVQVLVSEYGCGVVRRLVAGVQRAAGASGLLLQAVAARCQPSLRDEFALNTYKILSLSHESQSGPLLFLICRIIGNLEPAIAVRFANLAIERCKLLSDMSVEKVHAQLSKEDVQVALEILQKDKVHVRYSILVKELNSLASSMFDLSPLDMSQDRAINPQYIITTNVDNSWLVNQIKSRCCQKDCKIPKVPKHNELAQLLANLSKNDLTTVMTCPEFDRKLIAPCFKIACDKFVREFLDVAYVFEKREIEKDRKREQKEMQKIKEDMTSSVDSNKLNVSNTLHVFKKSDNKESKSQFFIPITDQNDQKENFGNLEITEEEYELVLPELPDMYQVCVSTLEKCLSDILRLFPKQSRPLSQSENFSLNVEQTIDRYTRRCHQVFQDKLFYQEFNTIQTILAGFLKALDRIIGTIDQFDCDLLEKCINNILPSSLIKNLAIFSVVSLQYLSFLIKNKKIVESPVHADVSFRTTDVNENIVVDNVLVVTIENVANALTFEEIWSELNTDNNINRTQSAISCLYAIVKYLVQDTKPLTLKHHIQPPEGPKSDIIVVGDKLLTLVEYWEEQFYANVISDHLGKCYRKPLESLLVSLARLDIVSSIALIPPIAWSSVDVVADKDELQKIDLPLQALQDLDVLEAFLFRVNLIGWSSRKQFEEIWVALLGSLQGNGPHFAIRGITQVLITALPAPRRRGVGTASRVTTHVTSGMQRLRSLLVGTSSLHLMEDVNLERIPLKEDGCDAYHQAQFNTEYLKYAADIVDDASFRVRQEVKRVKKNIDIDINSCLQILMDVTSQMLDPKSNASVSSVAALTSWLAGAGAAYTAPAHWCAAADQLVRLPARHHASTAPATLRALAHCLTVLEGFQGLQELSTVDEKLLTTLSSSHAPLRQAALHGCLLQLCDRKPSDPYRELVNTLSGNVTKHMPNNDRISLYEQSLYWAILFTLVEHGHPELMNLAVDFVLTKPRHYCTDLVVKGITTAIQRKILPKELKKTIIEKLMDNMNNYPERHAVYIIMVHLFTADNKLLSPKLTSDVSNMDPDILMNSMERITLLYTVLRQTREKESREIVISTLKYFLRETLPPAATLSRVVIEFLESCKETEKKKMEILSERERCIQCSVMNSEVVFEVFETAVSQDQLPVVSGWIFEALCHLLSGKISSNLLPYCVLTLLVSASSNEYIRKLAPLCYYSMKLGFHKNVAVDPDWGIFSDYVKDTGAMSFADRRLLCVVARHSGFSSAQLERLRELCVDNECLSDVLLCLEA